MAKPLPWLPPVIAASFPSSLLVTLVSLAFVQESDARASFWFRRGFGKASQSLWPLPPIDWGAKKNRFVAALGMTLERRLQQRLGDGDFGAEVDVLYGVQELDAFLHGALERFAAGDEASATGTLVDNRRSNRFLEIVGAGSAAAVGEAPAPQRPAGDLLAGKGNGRCTAEVFLAHL